MARYRTPDSLVCIGGAGRKIGETFLTQEWIIEEILREDPRDVAPQEGQPSHERGIQAFFIDTDTSSAGGVESDVDELVRKVKNEHDIQVAPDIKVDYTNIVEESNRDLDADAFLHEPTIQDVLRENNSRAWWLTSSQEVGSSAMLDELNDFRDGVKRRRGLTKAVYQMGYEEADPLGDVVESIGGDHTAMVIGLGGGSGSGLFLDLAYRMRSEHATSITLFAVLPDPDFFDEDNELANTYAALAELEYLALNDQNLFENIILLPLRPAENHDIFDKAATYAITGFYNLREAPGNIYDVFDEESEIGPPKYAPFTVAVPRYLNYLKEDIDTTKDNLQEFVKDKQEAQEKEAELYDELGSYIMSYHGEYAGSLWTTDGRPDENTRLEDSRARELLKDRLRPLRTLLEEDFLVEIDYDSGAEAAETLQNYEEQIRNRIDVPEGGDEVAFVAREMFERGPTAISTIDDIRPSQGFVPGEERFAELVVDEIELIARRARLLRITDQLIDRDETLGNDLKDALDPTVTDHIAATEDHLNTVRTDKRNLKEEIENLEEVVREVESQREDLLDEWETKVEDHIETLFQIDNNRDEIESLLTSLEDEIDNAIESAEEASIPADVEYLNGGPDFDEYTRLNNLLSTIGAEKVPSEDIDSSIDAMWRARTAQLKAEEQSVKDEVLAKVRIGRSKADYFDDYRQERIENIEPDVLTISEPTDDFDVTVQDSLIEERRQYIYNTREDAVSSILEATDEMMSKASSISLDDITDSPVPDVNSVEEHEDAALTPRERIKARLDAESEPDIFSDSDTVHAVVTDFRENPVRDLINKALLGPVQTALSNKRNKLEDLDEEESQYETFIEIVRQRGNRFADRMSDVRDIEEIPVFDDPEEGPFKREKMPNRGAIGDADHLGETLLWEEGEMGERRIIEDDLADLMDLNAGSSHIGLHTFQPSLDVGRDGTDLHHRTYDGHRAHTTLMSPLFDGFDEDPSALIDQVKSTLTGDTTPFSLGDNYQSTRGEFADDWDISVTTYIGGVFLDNLKLFTDECRDAYEKFIDFNSGDTRQNALDSVPGTVMRHTYGIDGDLYHNEPDAIPSESDGVFFWRKDILKFNRTEDIKVIFDQHEDEKQNHQMVADELKQSYYEVVGYPSTVQIKEVE